MRGLVFVALFFLSGCYKYVPLEGPPGSVERGTELRTVFSEARSVDLVDVTAHNIIAMDAEFIRQEDSELLVSAFYLDSSTRDAGYLGNGWTVRVPVESISEIQVKKFDWFRSIGIVALAGAVSLFGWEAISGGETGDDVGSGGGDDVIR